MDNLKRHLNNLQEHFGLRCVVAINHFIQDTDDEVMLIKNTVESLGAKAVIARHWAEGGAGAEELAQQVLAMLDEDKDSFQFLYEDSQPLWEKITTVATKIYKSIRSRC